MVGQDATHEMRRSEAMGMGAAHGCVVAADSRQRKPQRVLVARAPRLHYTDGRMEPKDGVNLAYAS